MLPDFTLDSLYDCFPASPDRPEIEPVAVKLVPEPYRELLVHSHHMTVTVESFYGSPVDVRVLEVAKTGNDYARKILLALRPSGRIVQFGIVHIDLGMLDPIVSQEIVAGQTPLGRVLLQNDILRTVRPIQFFRLTPTPIMCEWFGLKEPTETYGRLGVIYTDLAPAIRVAEILTPISSVK